MLIPGFLLWVAHGSITGDIFLVAPNALAALSAACLIGVAMWLRRDDPAPGAPSPTGAADDE